MEEATGFNTYSDDLSLEILQDELNDLSSLRFKSMSFLNNVDYSLNSPLMVDEVEEFTKYVNGEPHNNRWNMNRWKTRRKLFSIMNLKYQSPNTFHKWFGSICLKCKPDLQLITELIQKTIEDSHMTYYVVNSFFKGWLNKEYINPKTTLPPSPILRWGEFMVELHYLTLVLNASTKEEVQNLSKIIKFTSSLSDLKTGYIIDLPSFGEVRICSGFVSFTKFKRICDRPMVLMMKDVVTYRFHSLLAMIQRVDSKYQINDWYNLLKLYELGDLILLESGNPAYKGIKLLEPISNLQMTRLVRRYRPLIPEFPSFGRHIDTTLEDLGTSLPRLKEFARQILKCQEIPLLLTYYGAYRHWGHPFVNALIGLRKLHERATKESAIDEEYANKLGSDLAYKVLKDQFKKRGKWMVNLNLVPDNNPLKMYIKEGSWPTPKVIIDYGPAWNKLPLIKCFDVPDMMDPSQIYSDKSFSMNKTDILRHVKLYPYQPIPTCKVLDHMINQPSTNWREFLQTINDHGLDTEDLVIGLKEKERELKEDGRFFSLMSWKLREYFVITEYLIKLYYIPLFNGITMADDLTTLTKKLLDSSSGQGLTDYNIISIANHIDYEKWNAHQRGKGNDPCFTVMGQFLGLPNLITRTHEFFSKTTFYYNQRPDLMKVENGELLNSTDNIVCWNGQLGGQEGIRQRGWCVVNALAIERESFELNTKVSLLAQGDNQVICSNFVIQKYKNENELKHNIDQIIKVNDQIMQRVITGVTKLGLSINYDETIQSADYICYGKIPIVRSNIMVLETKRWSSCSISTNDQMPSNGNVISTIGSNALSIAHHSTSPINTIIHYNFVGNLIRNLLDQHNPAMRSGTECILNCSNPNARLCYIIGSLYLDPCIGGISGLSLTRFLIRMFPDPVTESFSFWKLIHKHGPVWLQKLCCHYGTCQFAQLSLQNFNRLLEDPVSLNLRSSVSAKTEIKKAIRLELYNKVEKIPNILIRSAIAYSKEQNDVLTNFLLGIEPLFPRFLSEFKNATYLGITESIIGLFENSKTIRNVFKAKFRSKIDNIIINSEIQSISNLTNKVWIQNPGLIWLCSASHADQARYKSWGRQVVGATIPHPIELISPNFYNMLCNTCEKDPSQTTRYMITLVPKGLSSYDYTRGPYSAYLGSRTSESTSLIHPWEKETKIPVLKRASKLRDTVHWFVSPSSKLATSIFSILQGLTGTNWDTGTMGFKRTGCGPHRYYSARQSNAGFSAQSPAKLTRMITTTDTMMDINSDNYDFMYQSLIIYSQITTGELHDQNLAQGIYHYHINCEVCLRPVSEIQLESTITFIHPDVSQILESWKPEGAQWFTTKVIPYFPISNWDLESDQSKSFHIGRIEGFLFGEAVLTNNNPVNRTNLFPLTIAHHIYPKPYMQGLLDGLIRISGLQCLYRPSVIRFRHPKRTLYGAAIYLIELISMEPGLLAFWSTTPFIREFSSLPHKIPATYPLSTIDLGSTGRYYLKTNFKSWYLHNDKYTTLDSNLWIFSDVNSVKLVGSYLLSTKVVEILYSHTGHQDYVDRLRQYKEILDNLKDSTVIMDLTSLDGINSIRLIDREVRHAVKDIKVTLSNILMKHMLWTKECTSFVKTQKINMIPNSQEKYPTYPLCKSKKHPLISSLRLFQCATGAHYKIRSIITDLQIQYKDVLCVGDGSGGVSSWILRNSCKTRLIFNSLLNLEGVSLRGASPSGPAAVEMIPEISDRCVNLTSSWKNPSDLTSAATWEYFIQLKKSHDLNIDLIVLDMDCTNGKDISSIYNLLTKNLSKLLENNGVVIAKTYLHLLSSKETNILNLMAPIFKSSSICWTHFTSSHSSEFYTVFQAMTDHLINMTPDYITMDPFIKTLPAFRSEEEEFNRALDLSKLKLLEGVPREYLSDLSIELSTLLIIFGVETGIATLLGNLKSSLSNDLASVDHAYIVVIVSLNSILKLTYGHSGRNQIISDHQVRSCTQIFLGFLTWMSLVIKSLSVYNTILTRVNEISPFSWKLFSHPDEDLDYLHVSFSNCYTQHKNFHYDSYLSKITQLTRIFIRMFGYPKKPPSLEVIDNVLLHFDRGLNTIIFNRRCDIFSYLKSDPASNSNQILTDIQDISMTNLISVGVID